MGIDNHFTIEQFEISLRFPQRELEPQTVVRMIAEDGVDVWPFKVKKSDEYAPSLSGGDYVENLMLEFVRMLSRSFDSVSVRRDGIFYEVNGKGKVEIGKYWGEDIVQFVIDLGLVRAAFLRAGLEAPRFTHFNGWGVNKFFMAFCKETSIDMRMKASDREGIWDHNGNVVKAF